MPIDKNFYNEASAAKLGWEPSWFGEKYFDDQLVRSIKKWQKRNNIKSDGLCGPSTYRRIWTERQSNIDAYAPEDKQYSNYIVYNGEFFPINWPKVVLWSERGGMKARKGTYYDYTGRPKRPVRLFVNHWDVCLNSKACQTVLDKRGISVHFLIDNDGTIYQTLDMQHGAWHAGSERVNRASLGVEISNAYYPKYQSWYTENGFGERPIKENIRVHGELLQPFTDFYPVQVEALKELWKAINKSTNIPYETVTNQFSTTSKRYEQDAKYGKFSGFVSHYHVSKEKIDCAGLDIKNILEDVRTEEETGYPVKGDFCKNS
tara:strand:- start:2461 stop:3414 length:954 start_codon:yes stop_codon:yes gene_type:complete